ncbi:MAG: SDR family NAD(P)-dependent oxidoreductase [Acidobacteriota bacterium]|nr:MAG: SDR family NAD(P)-dependent oxidoreductase [Acidobacteriota bacterium]
MHFKTCVITGASSGIGRAVAAGLSRRCETVVLAARASRALTEAGAAIRESSKIPNVLLVEADFSELDEVWQAARRLRDSLGQIDLLVNNAGAYHSTRRVNSAGIERTLAVNYLSHFLLTQRLLPLLKRSAEARIVNVGSDSQRYGAIHREDLNLQRNYHGLRAYAQSKLANYLFTREFARRCPYANLAIFCIEPGLVRTNIGVKNSGLLHRLFWRIQLGVRSPRTPEEAADAILRLAAAPSGRERTGRYWNKNAQETMPELKTGEEARAQWLWEESLRLCGIGRFFEEVADKSVP